MPRKHIPSWTPETRLDETGIPYMDVVLTERFLLPPAALLKIGESVPVTIAELVALSGMPLPEVLSILSECAEVGQDIWLEINDLAEAAGQEGTIILDMRPDIEIDTEPLHESARLFHAQSPQTLLPYLRSLKRVLVLSHSDEHAWSATMSLRKMSIAAWMPRLTQTK